MALTTVTFDLWQTLILDSPELGRPRARVRLEGALAALVQEGRGYTLDEVIQASRRCYQRCDAVRNAGGDLTFDEQVDVFLEEIDRGLPGSISAATRVQIARRYADSYLEHPPAIDEWAEGTLRALKERGLKLGLICNTGATPGATQRVFLAQTGLGRHFDTLTFSDEERLSKPSARIFHITLARLGAAPEETVHVGDHPVNDVVGAKRAGLRAVWLRRDGARQPDIPPDAFIDSLRDAPEAIALLAAALPQA